MRLSARRLACLRRFAKRGSSSSADVRSGTSAEEIIVLVDEGRVRLRVIGGPPIAPTSPKSDSSFAGGLSSKKSK